MEKKYDVIIVGTGVAGLYCALNLEERYNICIISKASVEESDSYLAQGGICTMRGEDDFEPYFNDTMRAGHYENNKKTVELMIRSSDNIIKDLIACGVRFERDGGGELMYTREAAHSKARILFHKDITGKEITSRLMEEVRRRKNISVFDNTMMTDIIANKNICGGVVLKMPDGEIKRIYADYVVLASGGIGGMYKNSTNYRNLTGDALAAAIKHNIVTENLNYVQIHPTTLFSKNRGRRFLISESVRGEGALLYNAAGNRFTDELQPRDVVTNEIRRQMKLDNSEYVLEDLRPVGEETIRRHFPNILQRCMEEGYDVLKEPIPVVPAQHYFMGGIKVDLSSRTSMQRLYACGETSCNGVHGKNRLASNSLLESMVFAKRAAYDIEFAPKPPVYEDGEEYYTSEAELDKYRGIVYEMITGEKYKGENE